MKAKGYRRGGAPMGMKKPGNGPALQGKKAPSSTRAQRRSTLSRAQRNLLDSVQGAEGSKQATSVIQDLSDEYGFKPGKRAGARGRGRRSATPPGMNMGGAAMKTKGYAKGGAAMKTKGSAKGGARKPSSKKSGLYGR